MGNGTQCLRNGFIRRRWFFATKPYISGGAYIKKMSDYKDNGWIKLWTDRYWQFLKNNKSQLKDNPRMKLILSKI